ncbi:MAG: ATP-binding protein [Solirubrobacteraceae bacterium]
MARCAGCATENPDHARFCMGCGAALAARCAACGTELPAEARFCLQCGTPVAPLGRAAPAGTPATPVETPAPSQPTAVEERRTVSVLFADLSGYTSVAEKLDPEDVKDLLDDILGRLTEAVVRYGGRVDKYIGDNVMALFGAPLAHGDDPERAVRAGLDMQAVMEDINQPLRERHGVSFELRVGINTGEVLAGKMGEGYTVVGDAVNVAARLQAAARPGTVTVGERTQRATRHTIRYRELTAPLELKGKSKPVLAWEALDVPAPSAASSEGPARAPLVGRQSELETLSGLFQRMRGERRPHLVTLIGEAGVGKSRLLREFEEQLRRLPDPPLVRHGRCPAYGSGVVFWPLGEMLRSECGIVDGDSSEVAFGKLSTWLEQLHAPAGTDGQSLVVKAGLVARLLGIDPPAAISLPEAEDAQRTRELFFAAVRGIVEGLARERPLVIAWEDVHWADHGMLDLIEHLNQWVNAPVLQVCLARDELLERRSSWGGARRSASTLFLEPLGESETRALVAALLALDTPGEHVVDEVAARAEGNPLFAEEMVRLLAEDEEATASELPDSVHALLASRLDGLSSPERRILAHAAVVGRTFWEGALLAVAHEEGVVLQDVLLSLRQKDFVLAGEGLMLGGEPELAFKHVLIRDVAYSMLPKAVRAQKHFQVAEFIEERAGERLDEVVAILAEHYGRGVTLAQELKFESFQLEDYRAHALRYAEAAGDAAGRLYSNEEALSHFEAALRYGDENDETLARVAEKLGDVALRLGRADTAIDAWQSALEHHRGQESLERVAELHRKIGAALAYKGQRKRAIEHHQLGINLIKDGPPSLALVRLYEEAAWLYVQTGDNMLAIYASEKALRYAERLGEARAASRAHGIFGRVFGRIGDIAKARENLERAVELARGTDDHETVLALAALGHHLEVSEGDYAAAAGAYQEGLGLARQIGDVPAQIDLHAALAQLAAHTGSWDAVEQATDAAASLAEREGLIGKLCLPYAMRGLLHWRRAEWEASVEAYRRSLDLAEQVGGSEVSIVASLGLAEALSDQGQVSAAETTLSQALDTCERAGLIVQSVQVNAARAVLLVDIGRPEQADEAATQATRLADRVHYPVGDAAALEATGAVAPTAESCEMLGHAAEAWERLGRPLDSARCQALLGLRMRELDQADGVRELEGAIESYQRLGVQHRADRVREQASSALG